MKALPLTVSLVSLGLVFALTLLGCGGDSALSRIELTQKYPEEKYIQANGVALHYEQSGQGRPMVFLHGLLSSSYLWREITPALTYRNTVYSLDLMGFGLSEKPPSVEYSLDTYVGQLGAFLESLEIAHPILAGHGIGGRIALAYALRHKGAVRKLILMDVLPMPPAALPVSLRLLRFPGLGELLTGDWFLKRILLDGVEDKAVITKDLLQEYIAPYHDDPGARAALLKCLREFTPPTDSEQALQKRLASLEIPTLVMWGGNDEYTSLQIGRKLSDSLPQSEIAVILRSGHYIQEDRPEEVRAVIKRFINIQRKNEL